MKKILNITEAKTQSSLLAVNLEHVEGASSATFEVTVRMDESKLRGSIEEERWVLLALLAQRLDDAIRHHERNPEIR